MQSTDMGSGIEHRELTRNEDRVVCSCGYTHPVERGQILTNWTWCSTCQKIHPLKDSGGRLVVDAACPY